MGQDKNVQKEHDAAGNRFVPLTWLACICSQIFLIPLVWVLVQSVKSRLICSYFGWFG